MSFPFVLDPHWINRTGVYFHDIAYCSVCSHCRMGYDARVIHNIIRSAHNWPPAHRAYAPEGILECWNNGMMGLKKTEFKAHIIALSFLC